MNFKKSLLFVAVATCVLLDADAQKKPASATFSGNTAKIIGGKDAEPDEYPWIVALRGKNDENDFDAHFCGGTLIHPYWVLTAAHCIEDVPTPDDIQVVIGAHDLLNPKGAQTIDVIDIVPHPDFSDADSGSDIALLLLSKPPIPLPQTLDLAADPTTHQPGTDAVAMGWGTTIPDDDTSAPSILQSVALPVVSLEEANKPASYDGGLIPSMLAAGLPSGGIDTCKGDSGGPLVVFDDTTGRYQQIGVTSIGDGCAQPDKYGIYTRVTSFLPWINSFISPNLARWESRNGVVLAGNESNDTDRDGQSIVLEFAGDTVPHLPSSRFVLAPKIVTADNDSYPAIAFSRYRPPSEIIYNLQWTESLSSPATWTNLDTPSEPPTIDPTNPFREIVTFRSPSPTTTGYFRLHVIPQRTYVPAVESLSFPTFRSRSLTALDLSDTPHVNGLRRSFVLSQITESTEVNVTARSRAFVPTLRVLESASNTVVATGNASGEKITLTTTPGTSYFIEVASPSAADSGPFVLALFGDISLETLPIVPVGHDSVHTLSEADLLDPIFLPEQYYKHDFLLTSPPNVFIEFKMSSEVVDAYLAVVNPETGHAITNDDDGQAADEFNSYLPFVTSEFDAPLLIRASTAVELEVGAYALSASIGPTHQLNTNTNGNLSAADPVNTDGSHRDTYLLTGHTQGTPITVTLVSSTFDAFLQIYDGQNTLLDSNDDAPDAEGTNSSLTFIPKPNTHYLIQATSFEAGEVGPYTLTTSQ